VSGLLLLLLLLSPRQARAQGTDTAGPAALRPGLVVDPPRGVAYVMRPEGSVSAVDLATGTTRWTSTEKGKPLALAGDLLIVQLEPKRAGSRLELAALRTGDRGSVAVRGATELPSGVRVSTGETLEGDFKASARTSGNSAVVTWSFERAPRQGMPDAEETASGAPKPRKDTPPARSLGAVRLSLSTGAVTRLDAATARAAPREPAWILPPGKKIAAAAPAQYESADGRHILASEKAGDDRVWEKYRWTVYERGTGGKVGEMRTHTSFAPFVVRDRTLVYETTPYVRRGGEEQPAKLRGVSLETGQEVWSVPVREIVYRGPFPP